MVRLVDMATGESVMSISRDKSESMPVDEGVVTVGGDCLSASATEEEAGDGDDGMVGYESDEGE